MKNWKIIIFGGIIIGFLGVFLLVLAAFKDQVDLKNSRDIKVESDIKCYQNQNRLIPFKVKGAIRAGCTSYDGCEGEYTVIHKIKSSDDLDAKFGFLMSGIDTPFDFSKRNIAFEFNHAEGDFGTVTKLDVVQVSESMDEPNCFDCSFDCSDAFVDVTVLIHINKQQKPLFERTIVFVELDAPTDWQDAQIHLCFQTLPEDSSNPFKIQTLTDEFRDKDVSGTLKGINEYSNP